MDRYFKLTPSYGSWMYTSLYDFTGGSDVAIPFPASSPHLPNSTLEKISLRLRDFMP
jgi:hypothetical protein